MGANTAPLKSTGVVGETSDAGDGSSEGAPEGEASYIDRDNNMWKLLGGDAMLTSCRLYWVPSSELLRDEYQYNRVFKLESVSSSVLYHEASASIII